MDHNILGSFDFQSWHSKVLHIFKDTNGVPISQTVNKFGPPYVMDMI